MSSEKTLNTMGIWTAFWPLSYLPFCLEYKIWTDICFCQNDVKTHKNRNSNSHKKIHIIYDIRFFTKLTICETFLNCLKFKLFYRERENLWIIYWVIFTCTVREETGESFASKKLNIQKGKCRFELKFFGARFYSFNEQCYKSISDYSTRATSLQLDFCGNHLFWIFLFCM